MQKTNISYLTHTWNPIAMRCTPASIGCQNCWHLRTADRLKNNPGLPLDEREALGGVFPFVLRERELSAPLRTKKPAVIGVQFMGDLFHEDVDIASLTLVYDTMGQCPQHTFLVLTKRPERIYPMLYGRHGSSVDPEGKEGKNWRYFGEGDHHPNVWHGCTVCNQTEADRKIPELLKVPGKTFISYEPALGPVDFSRCLPHMWRCSGCGYRTNENIGRCKGYCHDPSGKSCDAVPCPKCGKLHYWTGSMASIDLIIAGGETGPGARPCNPEWALSVKDQCAAAGVPFFFKGFGKYRGPHPGWYQPSGRVLDGQEWDELPWGKGRG